MTATAPVQPESLKAGDIIHRPGDGARHEVVRTLGPWDIGTTGFDVRSLDDGTVRRTWLRNDETVEREESSDV